LLIALVWAINNAIQGFFFLITPTNLGNLPARDAQKYTPQHSHFSCKQAALKYFHSGKEYREKTS